MKTMVDTQKNAEPVAPKSDAQALRRFGTIGYEMYVQLILSGSLQ